jgi:ribosomal protein S18 acetylase RimI-like enzyme
MDEIVLQRASRDQHRLVLRQVLAQPNQRAAEVEDQVSHFIRYAREVGLDLNRQWIAWREGRAACSTLCIDSPGRMATLMLPAGTEGDGASEARRRLVRRVVEEAARRDVAFIQCTIPLDDRACQADLLAEGFWVLASLVYLECRVDDSHVASEGAKSASEAAVDWSVYDPGLRAALATLLEGTYRGSADCAALTGLRRTEDVIAGHQSVGLFRPERWLLARAGGQFTGCILLNEQPLYSSLEVVYLGVHEAFRRRGLGAALLRRGLAMAELSGLGRVTLAVDEGNRPALRLYEGFGFSPTMRRRALLHSLRPTSSSL